MKRIRWLAVLAGLAVALASGAPVTARATPRYVAIDVGTLGGASTVFNTPGATISKRGTAVGTSETAALDPFPQDCPDGPCHAAHAFEWRHGAITDLGALAGGFQSGLFEENARGVGVGFSENGQVDPMTGFPEFRGVIWRDGQIVNLGTLGGNESWASAINDRGQVSGFAANAVPDPYAQALCFPCATQSRAYLWQNGVMHDLGTLGGPDSAGGLLNERGDVAGSSFTNSTPNVATGIPTLDPFLWRHGKMRDLGGLGGVLGFANWLNSRGQVVGQSDMPGDQTAHPFFWDGERLVDLGTLGGNNGTALWVNDAAEVVGIADLPGSEVHHGFLWKHGTMRDLPPTPGALCSNAFAINARGQAVGNATDCYGNVLAAVLWDRGYAFDLSSLIGPSQLQLQEAVYINDRGEIAVDATLPNGDERMVLLVPAGLAANEGLRVGANAGPDSGTRSAARVTHSLFDSREILGASRDQLTRRYSFRIP